MSVENIFLFNDVVKVKVGIDSPVGIDAPSDGQVVEQNGLTYTYDATSTSWDITVLSNIVFVSGLTSSTTLSFSAGDILVNGTSQGTSTTISNNDVVQLSLENPTLNQSNTYSIVADGTTIDYIIELKNIYTDYKKHFLQ